MPRAIDKRAVRCELQGQQPPAWLEEPERFLEITWILPTTPTMVKETVAFVPTAYIRHGAHLLPGPRPSAGRFTNATARQDTERRMNDEIRFHIEMETERPRARCRTRAPGSAASRAMPSAAWRPTKEALRDGRGWAWFTGLTLDLELARRMLKQPGLTLVAIFALGIRIPVGVLPLHIVDALTTPPPVRDGNEIVILRNYTTSRSRGRS